MISFSASFSSFHISRPHLIKAHDYSHKSQKDLSFLQSCQSIKELKQFHSLIIKTCPSLQTQQAVYAKLLSLCASIAPFADLGYIYTLFVQLPNPDVNLYNSLFRCFSDSKNKEAFTIVLLSYSELIDRGLVANSYTYPFVLKTCAQLFAMREGEMVHAHVIKNGFVLDLYVLNTLMRFYGVLGHIENVRKMFDGSSQQDLVSWTTLIQGYVDNGNLKEGIDVFFEMCESGNRADEKMMVVVISACARLGDLSLGKKSHDYVIDNKVTIDVFVGNALVDMYLKCGDTDSACKVFHEMPVKNVVSWNAMISGLAQKGKVKEALNKFRKMQMSKFKPDDFTLIAVLNSCANLGALELGKWIHYYLDRNQIKVEGFLGNALIDMYAKCGSIIDALGVFEIMTLRDVYTYTSLISGLALHGEGEMALELFSEMLQTGIQPNRITFIGVLSACTHAGLLNEGRKIFADMSRVYNIRLEMEHYGCMVDLLGKAGLLTEAIEFVEHMPFEPDTIIWGTLLGACQIHKNSELAESVMEHIALTQPTSTEDGAYVLMSNIHASANKWREALKLRKSMKIKRLKKSPGCSSIELNGVVHEFRSGDKAHLNAEVIYSVLAQ